MIRTMLRVRARPGCEDAVESAWRTVAGRISALSGSLGQDLLLDVDDPRSRIVVTEWADRAALRDYQNGPLAARFAETVRPLCEPAGAGSYRVMRDPGGEGATVFVDVELTVPAARLAEFERGYPEVKARMARVPGYLREDLLREPGSDIYHIFAEWRGEAEFHRWIGDPAHARQEAGPIAPFLLDIRRRLFHAVADQEMSMHLVFGGVR
ncbi:antibiotic biosynthesis monooxygenase family protein [Micromonospora sp. CPCC 206060]|uniref:antibiotic biosynthesis monooxygenase family protein n=1 Tax=Micromonospora sp. CPCC 206060 TaxID=3122406 RepID=UPI002FF40D95